MEVMGISGAGVMGSISGGQMSAVQRTDSVSKNIQNEISDAQRQKQRLSSKGDISAKEKMKKDQELQQEISSLNTQLRMRQEVVQKEQKKEALSYEVRPVGEDEKKVENTDKSIEEIKDQDPQVRKLQNFEIQSKDTDKEKVDTEKEKERADTDTIGSRKETRAVVSGDSGIEQVKQQRRVITRMKDAIAILKGEIRQDEARGINVDDKKAELEKQEDKMQKASASQFSVLGEANKAMREARQAKMSEIQGGSKTAVKGEQEEQAMIKATNFSKENNDAAVQFFVR